MIEIIFLELMHQVREELKINDSTVVFPSDFERYYWAIGFFTGILEYLIFYHFYYSHY
jgi:hypothetical protein